MTMGARSPTELMSGASGECSRKPCIWATIDPAALGSRKVGSSSLSSPAYRNVTPKKMRSGIISQPSRRSDCACICCWWAWSGSMDMTVCGGLPDANRGIEPEVRCRFMGTCDSAGWWTSARSTLGTSVRMPRSQYPSPSAARR